MLEVVDIVKLLHRTNLDFNNLKMNKEIIFLNLKIRKDISNNNKINKLFLQIFLNVIIIKLETMRKHIISQLKMLSQSFKHKIEMHKQNGFI